MLPQIQNDLPFPHLAIINSGGLANKFKEDSEDYEKF